MLTRDRLAAGAAIAVLVRVIAAAVLIFGPWTDEPSELEGWDVARFQAIADAPGAPYLDHDVEYPPLTVVVAEFVLADNVVDSHQRLVAISVLIDLGLAAALARWWGANAATTYLLISLPMVPSGLLRLDLWAALAAVLAAAAIAPRDARPSQHRMLQTMRATITSAAFAVTSAAFAVLVTVGAMIKLWPALLIAAAVGVRQVRAAGVAAAVGAASGLIWLAVSGAGALEQITSLRGVTGWHVESIPGSLIALFGTDSPRLEADAFRIGELDDTIVLLGRILAIAVTLGATFLAVRSNRQPAERLALVMLVSVAALIITAPLLSPQFLLWLTPWAAIAHRDRAITTLTFGAVALTAGVLALFGPPDLDRAAAAAALLIRDGLIIAIIGVGLRRLTTSDRIEHT